MQELVAHLDQPEGSRLFQRAQCASSEIKKSLHLTQVNMQLETTVACVDIQLQQAQQEIDTSDAHILQLGQSLAAQRAQHNDHTEQAQGELKSQHDDLKSQHDDLKSQHDVLKAQNDSLKVQHENLKAQRDGIMVEQAKHEGAQTDWVRAHCEVCVCVTQLLRTNLMLWGAL